MRTFVILLLASLACGGCTWIALGANNVHHMTVEQATTPRIERRFRVLDAETRRPVPGATLTVVHNFDWMDDWVSHGTTDADGLLTMKLARQYLHLVGARVAAPGYLGRQDLPSQPSPHAGGGSLSNHPADVFIYRAPAPSMGLRVPPGFTGAFVYKLGPAKYDFPFPPNFPEGQRIWWTDVRLYATETVVEQPPPLGEGGWDGHPVEAVSRGGQLMPVVGPGASVEGIAAWHIGMRRQKSSHRSEGYVMFIGDRAAATVAAAAERPQRQ